MKKEEQKERGEEDYGGNLQSLEFFTISLIIIEGKEVNIKGYNL